MKTRSRSTYPTRLFALLPLVAAGACAPVEEPPPVDEEREGIGALGYASHSMDEVRMVVVGTADDGLNGPRDLDFNPDIPGELWVVNQLDDSTVTWRDLHTDSPTSEKLIDPFALHFMEEVSSISFATGMQFGTCQESRNTYNDQVAGNDFMGPALWSADPEVYAITNPEAVEANGGHDLGSHLDMLHESPLCMGIAWESANIYWTFDGLTGSISRYDFGHDHGPGYDDHSDGAVLRFVEADVERVPEVPSHLAYDRETRRLYIADTGNSRILRMDTLQGAPNRALPSSEPGVTLTEMIGVLFPVVADADTADLVHPSGITIQGDVLYVTDNATSRITAFDKETGERIDWLDTGLPEGSLMGIRVDDEGNIWTVDFVGDRLLRFEALD